MKEKIKAIIKKIFFFIANPRFIFCFGIAWVITNGWSYILFAVGTLFEIKWMIAVSAAYLAFLWLPVSPEKIITVAIAMFLLRWLFPNDKKTLAVLREMSAALKRKHKEHKEKKQAENKEKSYEDEKKD